MNFTNRPEALVIGGGIAGPATAMALQRVGIEATVYEARPAGTPAKEGAFLTLATNGLDALSLLGAETAAVEASFPTPGITLRSTTGKRLGEVRTGSAQHDRPASRTLRRADLYGALRDEALARGIRFEHGKRLLDAVEVGDGVRAVFADGTDAVGDVLIGADGVHSTVRRLIDPGAPPPAYGGLINTGGYAPEATVPAECGAYEMIFGRRAFFGYVAAPAGEVWWFANVPRREEPSRGEIDIDRHTLLELYETDAGPARELIEATPELMLPSPVHTVPRLRTWHSARMVVLGDAAHAPSPSSGQGASLSIEDALVLATALRDAPDARSAFARFEAERRPRVERIVKWAARMNSSKAAGPVGRVVRDALLPPVLRLTAGNRAAQEMYDYRVQAVAT